MPAESDRKPASRRTLAACCLLVSACPAAAMSAERIVSINVCTDQLVWTLVERERIVSLSHLAADPRASWIGPDAAGIYLNRGSAEEVIALDPDLIVTVPFSFRPTVATLERLGYTVLALPMAMRLDDIAANLLTLGEAVGERDRAAALAAELRADVEQLTFRGSDRPLFLRYEADGWVTGTDSLVADVARTAGFSTVGERLGFSGGRRVSLETLLGLQPEIIELGHPWNEPPALVSETLRHPALGALLERAARIDVPDVLWLCGSLRTLEALAELRRAREEMASSRSRGNRGE